MRQLEHAARSDGPAHRRRCSATSRRPGLTMTVGTVLLSSACLGARSATSWSSCSRSTRCSPSAPASSLAFVPFIYVKSEETSGCRKFEEQFPEAIDLIGRALRAGHAFTTGLAMAAEEIPAPVGEEFKLLYDRQNFGMPLPDAMRAFAARIPLIDARFFVTAVLTQRETGGNLGEVLDNLASVIRERFKVKRQVRVLTAHGRITGWILAGAAAGAGGRDVRRSRRGTCGCSPAIRWACR